MENETTFNTNNNNIITELTKLNSETYSDNSLKQHSIKNIRPKNKLIAIKEKKPLKLDRKKYQISQAEIAEKQKFKLKNDIKNLFKSSQFINHNLKSFQKELKINDTIVAIISTIIILLSFIQVFL